MDRISRLPECLIIHILSLLSDKEVKATSVLSKTWLRITDSITVELSFDDSHIPSKDFPSFVLRVLRRGTTDVQNVTLHLNSVYDADDTQLWIRAMEARNVKRIYLFLRKCYVLIHELFTCSAIEVLYVNGLVRLVLPPVINLPSLKILNLVLEDIDFGIYGTMPRLLSGCPALEELNLALGNSRCNGNLIIQSCTLRKFGLRFCGASEYRLSIDELHLDTPALEFLDASFITDVLQVHLVCTMPSLREIQFAVNFMALSVVNISSVAKIRFLMALHHVKSVSLCFTIMQVLFLGSMVGFPLLPNLTTLVVGVRLNFGPTMWLLKHMPNLEELVLNLVDNDLTCWRITELQGPRPQCLLTSLRAIAIRNFRGSEMEMKMAKYLLRYGARLQTLRISIFKSLAGAVGDCGPSATIDDLVDNLNADSIMHELSTTPSASAAVELIIA